MLILTHSLAIALGSGILFSYPEIATIAGVQGLIVYTLSSSLPLLIFAYLGPIIRKKCPAGFVLTEWARQRYGIVTALYLSLLTSVKPFTRPQQLMAQFHVLSLCALCMDSYPMSFRAKRIENDLLFESALLLHI